MAAARDLIARAHRLLGLAPPGDALDEVTYQDDLATLNNMIDGWNVSRMFILSALDVSQSVSGLPITIGPGGTINVTRPVRMESGAFIRLNGSDYGITWVGRAEYQALTDKSQAGDIACYGYYEPAAPLGRIYLWPYPSAAVELHLQLQVPLTEFANLTTDYTLAPGYKKALEYSLAEELAAGRKAADPQILRIAANARRVIRRGNVEVPQQGFIPAGAGPYAVFIAGL